MEPVDCYKGISNRLLVFGLQPVDIVILLLLFVFVHGIINSLIVDLVYVFIGYVIARRYRFRPPGYFISLFLYFVTPKHIPIPIQRERKTKK